MVGYITAGTLQVRQPFTTDLEKATKSLRIPLAARGSSAFNPYVEVLEALKKFDSTWTNANAVLLISDGLDTSRGFDSTAAGHTLVIDRTIREANKRRVSIFSFYAPSVGLTSRSRLAASYGQSSLNRVSNETGGKAFFIGDKLGLERAFGRVARELRSQYVVTYKPTRPFDGSYRRIEVKVTGADGDKYKVNAKRGYTADRDLIRK